MCIRDRPNNAVRFSSKASQLPGSNATGPRSTSIAGNKEVSGSLQETSNKATSVAGISLVIIIIPIIINNLQSKLRLHLSHFNNLSKTSQYRNI